MGPPLYTLQRIDAEGNLDPLDVVTYMTSQIKMSEAFTALL